MRTKEAVEVERKVAQRNVEKQIKVLEKLSESERNLTTQLVRRLSSFPLPVRLELIASSFVLALSVPPRERSYDSEGFDPSVQGSNHGARKGSC